MQKKYQGTRQDCTQKSANEIGKCVFKKSSKEPGKYVRKKGSKEVGRKV